MNKEFSDIFEARQRSIQKLSDVHSNPSTETDNPPSRIFSSILQQFQSENQAKKADSQSNSIEISNL